MVEIESRGDEIAVMLSAVEIEMLNEERFVDGSSSFEGETAIVTVQEMEDE
jgi:hypothetical protein